MTSKYVSERGAKEIKKYKYSGTDASLMYKYIVSPTAQWIVDSFYPPWLAPNTITVFGLALVASSHIAMAWYSPSMEEEAPSWVYLWAGMSLMVYQVLDVTDGKQARKTGNASPLGLLFDHGCDALNCVISAGTMASTLQLGPTYMSLAIILFPCSVFFMATWEEFYTGTLDLPIINGPNEGLAIMYFIYIATAFMGPSFWGQPSFMFPSINNNMLFLIATGISCTLTIILNTRNVYNTIGKGRHKDSFSRAFLGIIPFAGLIAVSALWVFLSPTDIVASHPRLLMWTTGLLFCKLVMHMMLSHLCDEPVQLVRKTLLIMVLVAFVAVSGLVPFASEYLVAQLFFLISLITYAHMVYWIILELTVILGIRCFAVKDTIKNKKN